MERMPPALRKRLGEETARALEDYAEVLGRRWRDHVMQTAAERFDGRLSTAEERFDVRLTTAEERFDVRLTTAEERFDVRFTAAEERFDGRLTATEERFDGRLDTVAADLRVEMQKGFTGIWQAMADLRQEFADARVELLRWSFLFWIGQVVAVASLLAFMLRGVAPR